MLAFLLVSTVASLVVSFVLGVRLLRLAMRTRELPELAIGLAFMIAGVIGYSLMLVGNPAAGAMPPETARLFFTAGYVLISLGVVCTYVFIWSVFERDSRWGWWLMVVGSVGAIATALPMADYRNEGFGNELLYWLGQLVRIASGVWGTVEAARWWVRMRKRMKLGLAEAIVANRFMLWGFANLATFVIFVSTSVTTGASEDVMTAGRILLISTLTFTTALCQWFAFLPPRFYRRRFESDTAATAAA